MSVELLKKIKEQTKNLTPREKNLLAKFLLQETGKIEDRNLGLAGENKEEKRRLQMEWLKANREKYGGQYVALDGDTLLGVGENYPEAHKKAIAAGVTDAFIGFLPPVDYVGEMGGWI